MVTTILNEIVRNKREEVALRKRETPLTHLKSDIAGLRVPLNFSGALMGDGVRLICEVKRASPSRGILQEEFDPSGLSSVYAQNGAAAISVLTETDHFLGSLRDLALVKQATVSHHLPILRKDFIFDPYQVYETRAAGADAMLLIVAILDPGQLKDLLGLAQELWLQCLVETHDEREIEIALNSGAEVIGINNRDLHTFETDLGVTERLRPLIPLDKIVVSESGIFTSADILRMRRIGVDAFLVGEAIVTASDKSAKVRELVGREL